MCKFGSGEIAVLPDFCNLCELTGGCSLDQFGENSIAKMNTEGHLEVFKGFDQPRHCILCLIFPVVKEQEEAFLKITDQEASSAGIMP